MEVVSGDGGCALLGWLQHGEVRKATEKQPRCNRTGEGSAG